MKKNLVACLLVTLLGASCLGPYRAFRGLNNWNATVTDADFVNELIFIGLWIIPVYQIVGAADVLVFNTIDYWGENPIREPGPFPEQWGAGPAAD